MKIIVWIILIVTCTALGQDTYEFDTVFVYEGNFKNTSKELQTETRYYYTNSEDSNYFLVICDYENREPGAVFRDNKKNKIAEFNISNTNFLELSNLQISGDYFKNNSYRNPITYKNISKEEKRINDSVVKYTYAIDRGKKFRIQTFDLIVKETTTEMPLGIGFADYYSLFPLGKREPKGLIINATTSERLEIILSSTSLTEIHSQILVVTFDTK